ncbi:MAG: hypothetical protein GWN92_26305 [candidate division Zixibacteria bacterium]|nr:hypothetical protein [candidate division Zixibacteria bacterium]
MKLTRTEGPDDGSMTVVFGCPNCDKEIAMLTNSMETQMVRSLDVKIGGRSIPAQPMETLRSSLSQKREEHFSEDSSSAAEHGGEASDTDGGSKCPFTSTVAEAFEQSDNELVWTEAAQERIERIPSFVRSMVRKSIEQHAKEKGYKKIDESVMAEIREQIGM